MIQSTNDEHFSAPITVVYPTETSRPVRLPDRHNGEDRAYWLYSNTIKLVWDGWERYDGEKTWGCTVVFNNGDDDIFLSWVRADEVAEILGWNK